YRRPRDHTPTAARLCRRQTLFTPPPPAGERKRPPASKARESCPAVILPSFVAPILARICVAEEGPVPFARTYHSFPVPHAFFMPPLAVCQGVHRLAVPAMFARWIPDTPDAVDDCIESGANGGGTPGGGPPTTRPALAAAAYPAPARSTTNCVPRRPRETRWRSTAYAATSSCFRARPRQSGAPGLSLRHSCGACCVSG